MALIERTETDMAEAADLEDLREWGFLIDYEAPGRGSCIDVVFARDLFSAVSRFRLDGRRFVSQITGIRQVGGTK